MSETVVETYHCPSCGAEYDGEGKLGTDYTCECGCRMSAWSVDVVRMTNIRWQAITMGMGVGLVLGGLVLLLGGQAWVGFATFDVAVIATYYPFYRYLLRSDSCDFKGDFYSFILILGCMVGFFSMFVIGGRFW